MVVVIIPHFSGRMVYHRGLHHMEKSVPLINSSGGEVLNSYVGTTTVSGHYLWPPNGSPTVVSHASFEQGSLVATSVQSSFF